MTSNYVFKDRIPEYKALHNARRRCELPNHPAYKYYGARGIKCLYTNSLEMIADIGMRPSINHSLDRIDNDDDYRIGNCRWATRIEQANNKTNNHYLTIGNVKLTLTQWVRELGCNKWTVIDRLKRGFTELEALGLHYNKRLRAI